MEQVWVDVDGNRVASEDTVMGWGGSGYNYQFGYFTKDGKGAECLDAIDACQLAGIAPQEGAVYIQEVVGNSGYYTRKWVHKAGAWRIYSTTVPYEQPDSE